jgi:hypothetical protein
MDNLDLILKSGGLNPITHDVFTGREDKLVDYFWFRRLVYPNVEDFEDISDSINRLRFFGNSLVSVLINMKLNENGNYLLDENGKLSVVRIDVQTRWGTYKLSISEFKEIFKVEIRELILENLLNL